jgi:hypothetical protein
VAVFALLDWKAGAVMLRYRRLVAGLALAGCVVAGGIAAGQANASEMRRVDFDSPAVSGAFSQAAPSVAARVLKGNKSTGRYVPQVFNYNFKLPTLQGVPAKAKRAFDKRVDSLVAEELAFYATGALTQEQFNQDLAQNGGPNQTASSWRSWCQEGFKDLTGKFSSSVYKGRYASVVITFTGLNAPCVALGGMWNGYETERSVTIDTKTGKFKTLSDFTSNKGGEVTAAMKAWHSKHRSESLENPPKVTKNLKVCDRPANLITDSPTQKSCYKQPSKKTGPVGWQVKDSGLQLNFPTGGGPGSATLKWSRIPQLL